MQILYPFAIRHHHAAGVSENIGQKIYAAPFQNRVRLRGRGSVCRLYHQTAVEIFRNLFRNLVFKRRRNQDIALCGQKLFIVYMFGAIFVVILYQPAVLCMRQNGGNIQTAFFSDSARNVRNSHYAATFFMQQPCRHATNVTKALYGDGYVLGRQLEFVEHFHGDNHHASARRVRAAQRTADFQVLTRDHSRNGVPVHHGVGIHYPVHHLRIGAHVGGGDILFGAYYRQNHGGISARKPFKFAF